MFLSILRSRRTRWLWVPTFVIAFAACDDDPTTPAATDDIVDIVVATDAVSTLETAVVQAGLVSTLQGAGPFTVFAPANSAFAAIDSDVLTALLAAENADLLAKILTYHVVAGTAAFSSGLTDGQMVPTVEGGAVTIGVSGGMVTVDGATVTQADIEATNGVIHLIDEVLLPDLDLIDTGVVNGFLTLVDLVRTASLEATLRSSNGGAGFTVFAPTEAAFGALTSVPTGAALAEVLTYHVVPSTVLSGSLTDGQVVTTVQGGTFTVNINGAAVSLTDGAGNTVNVVAVDVPATNGMVHVIDGVILPN